MFPIRSVSRPRALDGQQNGWVAPDRMRTVTTTGGHATLVGAAAAAWLDLCAAAEAAGHVLVPYSTYRSYEKQEALFLARYKTTPKAGADTKFWKSRTWWCHTPPTTAAPGTSNHGWGLAVDVRVKRGGVVKPIDDSALAWLLAGNALAHGFSWEIQSEPWHLRYFAGDRPNTPIQIEEDPLMAAADDIMAAISSLRERVDDRTGLVVNTVNARTGMIYNAVVADDLDESAVVAGVLAGLSSVTLSDEQVQRIIDAIPEQVKVALRAGTGE